MEEISKEDLVNRQILSHFTDSKTSVTETRGSVTLGIQAPVAELYKEAKIHTAIYKKVPIAKSKALASLLLK